MFFINRENTEDLEYLSLSPGNMKIQTRNGTSQNYLSARDIEFCTWVISQKCSFLVSASTLSVLLRGWRQEEMELIFLKGFKMQVLFSFTVMKCLSLNSKIGHNSNFYHLIWKIHFDHDFYLTLDEYNNTLKHSFSELGTPKVLQLCKAFSILLSKETAKKITKLVDGFKYIGSV